MRNTTKPLYFTATTIKRWPRRITEPRERNTRRSAGLTIIEVIFAIGIILVGLLGIAALIPIASEDANTSIRIDAASRYGLSVLAELKARNINEFHKQIVRCDIQTLVDSDDYFNFLNNRLNRLTPYPTTSPSPFRYYPQLPRTAPSQPPVGAGGNILSQRASFCIDPLLLSIEDKSEAEDLNYIRDRFPFYHETFQPQSSPISRIDSTQPPFPRLWRVSFFEYNTAGPPPPYGEALSQYLVSSHNELAFSSSEIRDNPRAQIINTDLSSYDRQTKQSYTWIATVVPSLYNNTRYKLSVVVIANRNRFDAPSNAQGSAYPNYALTSDMHESEVITTITGNPTKLGSSIELTIQAHNTLPNKVRANSWVMVSRRARLSDGSIFGQHDWFRVVQVGDLEISGNFWSRRLVLDGPSVNIAPGDQLTIIKDAIVVVEDEVNVADFQ